MTSATDLGISSIDNITTDTTPDFSMSCASTGNVVSLYVDGVLNATGTCLGSNIIITTLPLTDGSYVVTSTESSI